MTQVPNYLVQFVRQQVEAGKGRDYLDGLAFIKRLALSDPRLRPKDVAELLLGVEAAARLLGLQLPPLPGDRPLKWSELNAGLTLADLVTAAGRSTAPTTPTSDTSQTPNPSSRTPSSPIS